MHTKMHNMNKKYFIPHLVVEVSGMTDMRTKEMCVPKCTIKNMRLKMHNMNKNILYHKPDC